MHGILKNTISRYCPFKYQNIRTPPPPSLISLTLVTRLGKPTNFFSLHYRVSKNGGGGGGIFLRDLLQGIGLIEGNVKSPCLKSNLEKYFASAVICSLQNFCLAWLSNFVQYNLNGPVQRKNPGITTVPPPPGIWAHIRGRYCSAKKDDISL